MRDPLQGVTFFHGPPYNPHADNIFLKLPLPDTVGNIYYLLIFKLIPDTF